MVFSVAIGTPGGDKMNDPAKKSGRTYPRNAGYDEPDYTDQNAAVINLTNAGNQKTQQTCKHGVTHRDLIASGLFYDVVG